MIVSKFVNSNCTRLRYFCPVFCLIAGCKNCARALLSAQGCEDTSNAELSFWVFSDHEWAQFMSKQIVLAISMQIFDGFYKTSWSRPDTRLNDRLFARILKYVRHAIVWSLKFDMIDKIGRVNSCRESNSVCSSPHLKPKKGLPRDSQLTNPREHHCIGAIVTSFWKLQLHYVLTKFSITVSTYYRSFQLLQRRVCSLFTTAKPGLHTAW